MKYSVINSEQDKLKLDIKAKHLEFLEGIISRMNHNSFQIKGWMVTAELAILGFYLSNKNCKILLCAGVLAILCCLMDAFYLAREREAKRLYSRIVEDSDDVDVFQINLREKRGRLQGIPKALSSFSVWPVYLCIFVFIFILG